MGIGKGSQNFGSCWHYSSIGWSSRNMSLPTFVMPNLVILRVGTSVHTEVCQKNEDSSRLAFQGHSRSL